MCSPGYYCTLGAALATPVDGSTGDVCPAGLYCPLGSAVGVGCPKGTFSDRTGLTAPEECEHCTPGYFCSQLGLTAVSGTCWAGNKHSSALILRPE